MAQSGFQNLRTELESLEWGEGLTRDDVQRAMPHLPHRMYLELPASKRFRNADELLFEALNARSRAEGEVVREDFDAFTSEGAEDDGGPMAWGEDPIIGAHQEPS
ncbi:MAG TPA: hypothetical protein VFS62_02630 [Chloroflexota bacterium]|jgi:hypothetical protein|nr:hypothetical protein [Chloroflexota bacterium]